MISSEDRQILDLFSCSIRQRFPDAKIWLFGSRAKGTARWDSDFDVCVVLQRVDRGVDRWIREKAWKVGFDRDRVITTIVLDEEQFRHGPISESALVFHILEEGVAA